MTGQAAEVDPQCAAAVKATARGDYDRALIAHTACNGHRCACPCHLTRTGR